MADASVELEATNLFGLHANFNTSASTTSVAQTNVAVNDEVGNVECQTNISDIINYTQSASYCGSDFMSDIGTFLTKFGDAQTGTVTAVVTGLNINCTAGEYCTIELTGHQHDANPHAAGEALGYADMSDALPHEATEAFASWDGFGIPRNDAGTEAIAFTTGADSSASSASYSFSMNHVDQQDEEGSHLVGKNITPRYELSMDFVGVPTSSTAASLEADAVDNTTNNMYTPLVDSDDTNDSNSDFDTFSFTMHGNTDLATA